MTERARKRTAKETRSTYRTVRRQPLQRLVRALRATDPDIIDALEKHTHSK